jgi:hypothetical protein
MASANRPARAKLHGANPGRERLHGRDGRYDELQALFLMRLVRLTKLQDQLKVAGPRSAQRKKLVEAAFRSTLRDCAALGVEAEAHALLESD